MDIKINDSLMNQRSLNYLKSQFDSNFTVNEQLINLINIPDFNKIYKQVRIKILNQQKLNIDLKSSNSFNFNISWHGPSLQFTQPIKNTQNTFKSLKYFQSSLNIKPIFQESHYNLNNIYWYNRLKLQMFRTSDWYFQIYHKMEFQHVTNQFKLQPNL